MAQLPDDLIRAFGTVEIAGFLTSQFTNGLQSITLDQNRVTFPDPVFSVVPGFTQLGGGGKMILLHFVKKQSLHSRNPCAVKLQSGINGSATSAVLWTDFIPFAA